MSPKYAIDGVFSIKSDVFSSGVLVLDIVRGGGGDLLIQIMNSTFLGM
jgi:hypothetical protein